MRQLVGPDEAQVVTTTDIYVVALIMLHWTVNFTVAIAAFVVKVMKGPAYVAYAYPTQDGDTPGTSPSPRWRAYRPEAG